MSKAGVGLFVLRLLLLFIFLPLEESIWSYEHLIEEKIGEAICNQLYTACDAHASFKRPGKYDAPYAEQWHILKLGEYNSLRVEFKLCMCSSALSSVNSYALNGLDDWQQACRCCCFCFFSLFWALRRFSKEVFFFKRKGYLGYKGCPKQTGNHKDTLATKKRRNEKGCERDNRNICFDIVFFLAGHFFYWIAAEERRKKETFNRVSSSLIGRKPLTRPSWHWISRYKSNCLELS